MRVRVCVWMPDDGMVNRQVKKGRDRERERERERRARESLRPVLPAAVHSTLKLCGSGREIVYSLSPLEPRRSGC